MSDSRRRRSSILKPPKQRAPLQEVNSLNVHHHDDFTSTTITQNIMRRVSFAGTSTVKEFDKEAESVLVSHTPAYDESFAASDLSVPSDHSSRLSSCSTISIENQSTHPASSEGTLHEIVSNVQTEDELFADFGLPKPSQPAAKEPQRRFRFSIGTASDEEESPRAQDKGPSTIPSSLFFGKEKPKPKKSAISSPQLLKIDPFSLRPKPVPVSPKPHLKRKSVGPAAQPSPKSKSPTLRFAHSPNDSTSSEMELTESISGNIFVATPSPSSVASGATPQSVSIPRSVEFTSVGTPDWKNKTTLDGDMDFTRVMPTKILGRTETRSSAFGDGNLHCTFRNSVMVEFPQPVTGVAIRNEQYLVTGANQSVSCTTNSVVMELSRKDNDMKSLPATISRPEDMEDTEMVCRNGGSLETRTRPSNVAGVVMENVPVAGLNATVGDLERNDVVSSLSDLENRNSYDARNVTVCEPDGMELTRVIRGLPVLDRNEEQCRGPLSNQTLNDSAGMELTEAIPSMPVLQEIRSTPTVCNATLNKTLNDSVGMDLTEGIPYVPQLHTPGLGKTFCAEQLSKTLNEPAGMELTKVIETAPQLHTPGLSKSFRAEPLNKTLNDAVGMELTKAIPTFQQVPTPGLSKSFRAEPLNETLNDTAGMEFTKAVPTAPQLHTPGLSKSFRAEPLNKILSDTVGMELTKAIPTVPQSPTPGLSKSFRAEPLNETLNDTAGMEFTKVVPTAPQLHTPGLSRSFRGEPLNKTLNDTVGMEFTKVIPTVPQLPTPGLSKSFNKTLNDSVGMEFTKVIPTAAISSERVVAHSVDMDFTETVSARQFDNVSGDATDSVIPSSLRRDTVFSSSVLKGSTSTFSRLPASDGKNTLPDSVRVEFTNVGTTTVLLDNVKANESFKLPSPEKGSSSKPIEIKPSPSADPGTISITPETLIPVSVNDLSIQRTEYTTLTKLSTNSSILTASTGLTVQSSGTETSISRADGINTSLQSQSQATVPPSNVEANLSRTDNFPSSQSPVQETHQTRLPEADSASTGDDITSSQGTSLQTTLTSHPLPTPLKLQVSRKRSIDEVDDSEPDEIASRSLNSSAPIAVSEIVIPSSRSPSPVEQDSSTRFPGLSQSFSSNRSLTNSEAASPVNPPVTDDPLTIEYHHTIPAEVKEVSDCDTNVHPSSNPVEALSSPDNLPVPVDRPTDVESDGTPSSSTSSVLRKFTTPDECNITDYSPSTIPMIPDQPCSTLKTDNLSHKLILDVSVPSMLENSFLGVEQDVSSNARLYATLLEAENNVSLFHQERDGNASSVEESMNVSREEVEVLPINTEEEKNMSVCEEDEQKDIPEEDGGCRGDSSNVCEEQRRKTVEGRRALLEESEKSASRTLEDKTVLSSVPASLTNCVLPSESPPCLIAPDRRSLFDRTSTNITGVSLLVAASRTAEEIIRTHWLEYRKRERCNWTWQKLSDGEWSFYYLDDSVELQIKVEESSRNELLSGHGGRFISLLDDSLDGLWHIGGRLLYQVLSSEKWSSRLQKTGDVLSLVEDVNRVANDVEKFKTTLAYLQITKNIDITNDWICFDVLSQKSSNIWFKVKVDCRDVLNLQQSHVSIENILGETRETDIQNLVTCLKKGPYIMKNYVALVEEYVKTIERIQ